jgi:hypothetical protein
MTRVLIALVLLASFPLGAAAERYILPAQFWLNPRSGQVVAADPTLAKAVQRFIGLPRASMILHHGREDESLAQAEELRGWLIALGVEASRISLAETRVIASAADRNLTIEVIENK